MARINTLYKEYTEEEYGSLRAANEAQPDWQAEGREIAREIIEYFVDEWALIDEYIILAKISKMVKK